MLRKINNKRGVSEMVSYVLLVVIAVGLSILVYAYLKVLIPKSSNTCEDGINLIVENYTCNAPNAANPTGNITLTLYNKGLFNVSTAFIRIGNGSETARLTLYSPNLEFSSAGQDFPAGGLAPGQYFTPDVPYSLSYHNGVTGPGNYTVEVEPATLTNKGLISCSDAIVTEDIQCN